MHVRKKKKKSRKNNLKIKVKIFVELQFFSKHLLESVKNEQKNPANKWRIKVIIGNADQQMEA